MKNIIRISLLLLMISSTGCESDDISTGEVPADVTLIAPFENESCEEGVSSEGEKSRLLFEWERAENAQYYDLIVTDLETGENFITYKEIYDSSKELELIRNRAYSWQVISKTSENEETGSSPVWNFFLVGEAQSNYAPFPATLTTPEYGELFESSDGTVQFEWEGSDPDNDELTYTLYVDSVDGKQDPAEELQELTTTSTEVQLEPNNTYYWRVKTSDGSNSSFSVIATFEL